MGLVVAKLALPFEYRSVRTLARQRRVLAVGGVHRGRPNRRVAKGTLAVRSVKAGTSVGRAAVRAIDCGRVSFVERSDDNLGAGRNVLFAEGCTVVSELVVEGVHDGLAIGANYSVCVVKQQFVDYALVLHGQLRSHDVFLHLPAELLKSPGGVELDFKFDLLGTLGVDIRLLTGRVALLQMAVFYFDGHKQLDALVVLVLHLVARHEGRLLAHWVWRPLLRLHLLLLEARLRLALDWRVGRLLRSRLEFKSLGCAGLLGNFALLLDVGQVAGRVNL